MKVAWLFNTLSVKHFKKGIQVGSLFNTPRRWQQQTYLSFLKWIRMMRFQHGKVKAPISAGSAQVVQGSGWQEEWGERNWKGILNSHQPTSFTYSPSNPALWVCNGEKLRSEEGCLTSAGPQPAYVNCTISLGQQISPKKALRHTRPHHGVEEKTVLGLHQSLKKTHCFKCGITLVQGFKIKIVTSFITVR